MTGSWGGVGVLAVGFGLAIGGGLYLINEKMGADVILSEKGISRKRFEFFVLTGEAWLWEDVERCAVARVEIGGQDHPILLVSGKSGRTYPIGLGGTQPEKVQQWFKENGREFDPQPASSAQDLQTLMNQALPPSQTGNVQL